MRKRVCIFCEKWESGGIESFLHNVLTRIDLSDLEVDIVVSSLGESVFTAGLQARGIGFYELSGSQRKLVKNHRMFQKLLRRRNYDVLYLNAFQALSFYYLRLAREAGVPVRIAHSHNTALRKSGTRWVKLRIHQWAKERYTKYATDLWACSEAAAQFLFSKPPLAERGFRFIPNGIDLKRFRFNPSGRETVRAQLGLEDQFVVGNVGRLCYQKNQSFLLDVFAELRRRAAGSVLLLVGEGEDKALLEKKAKTLGIAEAVRFYGVSDHVEQLLWAMDVFVMPSRFEGLGIVAIESQAAGLPVVCSEHVPAEACVTELFRVQTLDSGAAQWAEVLLKTREEALSKDHALSALQRAGFDISDVAQMVQDSYLRDSKI